MVDPAPQLARPEGRLAEPRHGLAQLAAGEANQVHPAVEGIGRRRELFGMGVSAHGACLNGTGRLTQAEADWLRHTGGASYRPQALVMAPKALLKPSRE